MARSLPGAMCWSCGAHNDSAAAVGEWSGVPHNGAVVVCLYCEAVGVIDDGKVRQPTPAETISIEREPEVHQARTTIRLLHAFGKVERR